MSQEVIQRMQTLVDGFDARVQAAGDDSWENPSPCEGWKARDVVVHVANNYMNLGRAIAGGDYADVGDDEDIVAAWGRAKQAIAAALASDLSQNAPGPMGPMPAADMIGRFVAMDTLVHTWDLARATGGDERLPEDAVEGGYSGLKPMDAMIRRPGLFGSKVEPPAGADLQTEFLCFLGRQV